MNSDKKVSSWDGPIAFALFGGLVVLPLLLVLLSQVTVHSESLLAFIVAVTTTWTMLAKRSGPV